MARAKMNEDSRTMYLARALYDAVEDCNVQQVNTLLSQNKANPNVLIPDEGMTAFHLAAGHENLAFGKVVTSLFLHNGGNPNVRCDGNRTVLHIAVAWNRSSVVEILLKSPYIVPDLFIKDDDNLNVFNYAVKFNAWESLATLQSHIKQSYHTNNSTNQICKPVQPIPVKQEDIFTKEQNNEKSIDNNTTFNKSDKLHTSSGYFNSGESLNSTSNSKKSNLVDEKKNLSCESILSSVSSTDNSLEDILNRNISSDYENSELDDIPSSIYADRSLNSLECVNNGFESIENISFPSNNLLTDSESLFESQKVVLTTKNNYNQSKDISLSNSEWMTDISELSNWHSSDDFLTCPDTNSEQYLTNSNYRNDITDNKLEDITYKTCDSKSQSISKISTGIDNLRISDHYIDSAEDYDTDYVRQSLRKYGVPPGPIVPSTKHLYVRKLNRIVKNQAAFKNDSKINNTSTVCSYSSQLTKVLTSDESWKRTILSWSTLEENIIFNKNGSSFTYLLLDPRISKNLPARANKIKNPIEIWQTFISSIFYIGKGTKSRPNDHMNEAFNFWIEKNNKEKSRKVEYILSLWKEHLGVVCVQAFHHLIMKEAHIREAAMIDAIGLDALTNEKRGTYYEITARWRNSDRCKLGCYLLYRAMLVFLADGERQLKPIDLT
ncbi:uncharacterized protein LOC112689739 isoform X2 [Sipha flava]|uniref:Uncharacterized protein LOC112689739 isoform X2 n=1 Tax=Sipha flava TaxID=143950 RepID=A0A8B8G947_9HEMI|nr:uncharacterized protein LOC112689739 isoform X2 [Sipha flava]